MTTLSDVAVPSGSGSTAVSEPQAWARRARRARVPSSVTLRAVDVGRDVLATTRTDVTNAWFVRKSPPSLAELWNARMADRSKVPGKCESLASWVLYGMWVVYNHVVAVPVSAVGYAALWVIQQPVRVLALGLPVGVLLAVGWFAAHPFHPHYR